MTPTPSRPRRPSSSIEWSRRAIIDTVRTLHPHVSSLTLIGGHAVHLRSVALDVPMLPTTDGDLALTPGLVADAPSIEVLMLEAGWVRRIRSRAGLWGREAYLDRFGNTQYREQVDLDAPYLLSGAKEPSGRSVPALAGHHGKMSVGNVPGLELAVFDRSVITLVDFVDPTLTVKVNVAGSAALLMAKAYKISERMAEAGAPRLKAKDLGDLWRLSASASPQHLASVFDRYVHDPSIGVAVTLGREHLHRILDDRLSAFLASESLAGYVSVQSVAETFTELRLAFLTSYE